MVSKCLKNGKKPICPLGSRKSYNEDKKYFQGGVKIPLTLPHVPLRIRMIQEINVLKTFYFKNTVSAFCHY